MSTPHSSHLADLHHAKQTAPPTDLGNGAFSLPVPLAGSPLGAVTVYAIRTSVGLVLIDAAYDHESCWTSLCTSLREIGHDISEIVAVLLTHNHPDHVGLADRIRASSGARLVMHAKDDFATQQRERGRFLDQLCQVLARSGAPAEVAEEMYVAGTKVAVHREDLVLDTVLTEPVTDLVFGDTTIQAVHAPGHTYGHTVYLHPQGALFTGDTLMPEGPTQLALTPLPGDDPAGDLLASLDVIAGLDAELACPAHQYPFTGIADRCHELRDLHAAELGHARDLSAQHPDAWHVAPHLTWAKPWAEMGANTQRFALVHTLALLGHRPEPGAHSTLPSSSSPAPERTPH